ncbi:MAG TPA: M20 family metallopeptidase [Gemmatimonadales bacterium]|nr:M20 family metallopeptidase [Gemmatimonadales bacterium]
MTIQLPAVDRASLIATRRDLHQHPELGFETTRTAGLVVERLQALGYTVRSGVGKVGVLGMRGAGNACVLLRADMDALPVKEANQVPYRSRHDGKMHACGHDGHVAVGLEVARRLAGLTLPGVVKFAFQPAEETSDGAAAMIRDGILDQPRVSAAFGIHLWNELPVGTIGVMAGPVMASVDEFEITITGRGGHAAIPQLAIDPVLVAAHVITALQSLVSRRRDPFEEGVVSVTQVSAGHAFNVIPETAQLRGTVRTFGGRFWEAAPKLVEDTVTGIAAALGARAEVRFARLSKPLINDERMAALMKDVAEEVVGKESVRGGVRTMGGEDMSEFLRRVPGCFAFVGSARQDGTSSPHHSPTFDIEEEALVIGAELLTRTAVRFLEKA